MGGKTVGPIPIRAARRSRPPLRARSASALRPGVAVDIVEVAEWASRLIAQRSLPGDLSLNLPLADALDLLPGCYDDWAILERERMRQRMLHALEALSRAMTASGRYGEAVEAAMMAIGVEPLRESAQRALLQAHLAESNLIEARRDFLSFRDLVRRELGVEPSMELAALVYWRQSGSRDPTPRRQLQSPSEMGSAMRAAAGHRLWPATGAGEAPEILVYPPPADLCSNRSIRQRCRPIALIARRFVGATNIVSCRPPRQPARPGLGPY